MEKSKQSKQSKTKQKQKPKPRREIYWPEKQDEMERKKQNRENKKVEQNDSRAGIYIPDFYVPHTYFISQPSCNIDTSGSPIDQGDLDLLFVDKESIQTISATIEEGSKALEISVSESAKVFQNSVGGGETLAGGEALVGGLESSAEIISGDFGGFVIPCVPL